MVNNYISDFLAFAISASKRKHPDIIDGYSTDNVSIADIERVLWYILQTYPNIANDNNIIRLAQEKQCDKKRTEWMNDFLVDYFSDAGFEAEQVLERNTVAILNYLLQNYPQLWEDDELIQAAALFTRTSLKQFHNNGGVAYDKYFAKTD